MMLFGEDRSQGTNEESGYKTLAIASTRIQAIDRFQKGKTPG